MTNRDRLLTVVPTKIPTVENRTGSASWLTPRVQKFDCSVSSAGPVARGCAGNPAFLLHCGGVAPVRALCAQRYLSHAVLEVVPHIPFWGCKTLEPNRLGVYFQWLQQPSELHCSQRPSPNEFTPRSSVITIQRRKQIAEEPCLQAAPFSSSKVQHSEFSAAAPTQSQ